MASRAEILASNRGKEPKSPGIYRRGRVNNSAAYYRAAKPQMDKAGRQSKALSEFISAVAKPIGSIVKAEQEEFIEAERNAGIASYTRATPEQRAKMRRAIQDGIISESESPYYREGVSIAYTKNLLNKYNDDLFRQYEEWDQKNDPNQGTFEELLDRVDSEYAPYFETIHEDILVEHFVPGQMGIRRQLQQRHTEHLNKNYRDNSMYEKQHEFFNFLKDNFPEVIKGYLKHSNKNVETTVKDEEVDAEEKRTKVLEKKILTESGGTKQIKEDSKIVLRKEGKFLVPDIMPYTDSKLKKWAKKKGIPEENIPELKKLKSGESYDHLIRK